MLYIINDKPYIKLSSYYREVEVTKKGKDYNVKPLSGERTKISTEKVNLDKLQITQKTVEDYYLHKASRRINREDIELD